MLAALAFDAPLATQPLAARFDEIWAAAGHPNGVFRLSPQELEALTGAPVADVVQVPAP